MNPINKTVIAFLFPSLISLTGCLDEKVKTIINEDGSCQRTISMKLQSKSVPENAFPTGTDGWSVEWRESGDTSIPYEYVAVKMFPTPAEFRAEYLPDSTSRAIRIDASIEKQFQWFYTYIDYRETYYFKNPYGNLSVTDFLTAEEIVQFQRGEKEDTLNEKVEKWIERDRFEEFYAALVDTVEEMKDPALPVSVLHDNKERFASMLSETDPTRETGKTYTDTTITEEEITLNIYLDAGEKIFGKTVTEKLRSAALQSIRNMQLKDELLKFPASWEYTTIMPGLLLESNGKTVQGNSITWKFRPNQAKVAAYIMHATSRVVNVWAFIVSGSLFILLIVIFLMRIVRRRQK